MSNPLIKNIKLPGRVFPLPSKGLFYKDGVLSEKAKKSGEIEVRPMSGIAELKLKSADLLYTGRVLQELCNDCIPDIIKADELSTKDIDAIFFYLRIATYGPDFSVNFVHTCEHAKEHTYKFSLEQMIMNQNNEILEGSVDSLFTVKLSNGQVVKLKPMSFDDNTKIMFIRQDATKKLREISNEEYVKIVQNLNVEDTLGIIESVDGITDREQIKEWVIKELTKPQTTELLNRYLEAMKWGIDLEKELTCKDCGEKFKYDLQLDPMSFFIE